MKKIWVLLLLLVSVVMPVTAKEDNFFAAEGSLEVKESVDATTFAASNNIKSSAQINGIGFFAGNMVTVSGASDYVFAAGNIVTIDGVSTNDVFVAGNQLSIQNSTIRDLYAAGTYITVDSDVERNLYVAGTNVVIHSHIGGDLKISGDSIQIGEDTIIDGTLYYPEGVQLTIPDSAIVANVEEYELDDDVTIRNINPVQTMLWSFVFMLVIGLVFLAINKKAVKDMDEVEQKAGTFFMTALIGFGTLCLVPIASILLMVTIIGVPLAIISLMIYGITIYISAVATAQYFSHWFVQRAVPNQYFSFAIALLVLYVARLIPIIGGFVTFLSLCFGLGMYTVLVIQGMKQKKETEVKEEPVKRKTEKKDTKEK